VPGWLLNTTDKGYSVVITMPKKMSLVRTAFDHMLFADEKGVFLGERGALEGAWRTGYPYA
jgi:hypothetical protein